MSDSLLLKLDVLLRKIHENKRPFGGVSLVLLEDLLQLPPVYHLRAEGNLSPTGWPRVCGTSTKDPVRWNESKRRKDTGNEALWCRTSPITRLQSFPRTYQHLLFEGGAGEHWQKEYLPEKLLIKPGARIMLQKNICVGEGLTNGTLGNLLEVNKNFLRIQVDQ